jgi:hypothetical protein
MTRNPKDAYLERARHLSGQEAERLLSRMRGKLMRRLEEEKLTPMEVVALQLEIEDEDLKEWRKRMSELKSKFNFDWQDAAQA